MHFLFPDPYFCFRRDPSVLTLWVEVVCFCEIMALMVLSLVTSKENMPIHSTGFTSFIIFALIHMLLRIYHSKRVHKTQQISARSHRKKVSMAKMFFVSIVFSAVFFEFHNQYCMPGMYTMFALMEYLVIGANIMFHFYATSDYHHFSLTLCAPKSATYNN